MVADLCVYFICADQGHLRFPFRPSHDLCSLIWTNRLNGRVGKEQRSMTIEKEDGELSERYATLSWEARVSLPESSLHSLSDPPMKCAL